MPWPRCSGKTRAIAYRLLWIDEGRPTPQPSASSPSSARIQALSLSDVTKCAISSTSTTSPETRFRISAHCSYCRWLDGVSNLSSTHEPYGGMFVAARPVCASPRAFLVGAAESAPYSGPMAAPVKLDDELDLRIESLAYGGNGVARLNGFVVFVRRGLPGDVVRARV